jgi:hypothetical protein
MLCSLTAILRSLRIYCITLARPVNGFSKKFFFFGGNFPAKPLHTFIPVFLGVA